MGKSKDVTKEKFTELVKELCRYTDELGPVWNQYSSNGSMNMTQFLNFLNTEQHVSVFFFCFNRILILTEDVVHVVFLFLNFGDNRTRARVFLFLFLKPS
jgi:hypothetical protein